MQNEELKHNLTSGNQWLRLLFMVLFYFLLYLAGFVMLVVVLLQFLFSIVTGSANDNLRRLGDQVASYIYQTLQFLIYNTEEKPFPFSEWPESDVEDLSGYESAEEVDTRAVAGEEEAEEAIVLGSEEEQKPRRKRAPARKKSTTTKPSTSKNTTGKKEEDGEKE